MNNKKLVHIKKHYYTYLDTKAKHIAKQLTFSKKVTPLVIKYVAELYEVAQIVGRDFSSDHFHSAYHEPILSDLEFLIARSLYYFSWFKKLNWDISLRKQSQKTVPDVLIKKNDIPIAIVEIKAAAGWIQPFFSSERVAKDKLRLESKASDFDPDISIKRIKDQLDKYEKVYGIPSTRIFLFLPTLAHVHRKKSKRVLRNYQNDFIRNSGLNKDNLIILSANLSLNLGFPQLRKDYKPTDYFERFIKKIEKAR